jgi:hypothetical protein
VVQEESDRIYFKIFWTPLQVSTNFRSLNYFLSGLKPAHGLRRACENGPRRRPATRGRPTSRLGPSLAARSSRGGSSRRAETGRAPCACSAVTARSRARNGTVTRLQQCGGGWPAARFYRRASVGSRGGIVQAEWRRGSP